MDKQSIILRTVEALSEKQNVWTETKMKDLKPGMIFKMYEPDGTPTIDKDGCSVWMAESDPYVTGNGIWGIKCKPDKKCIYNM